MIRASNRLSLRFNACISGLDVIIAQEARQLTYKYQSEVADEKKTNQLQRHKHESSVDIGIDRTGCGVCTGAQQRELSTIAMTKPVPSH